MENFERKAQYDIRDLLAIVRILRDPEHGCPWDKVQTHRSIRMNFIEEAYEAVDAIDQDDAHLMCEELGDVLMQVVFHTLLEEERSRFDFADVCDGVCKKLIFRHPHIFGGSDRENGEGVIKNWDALKNKEKGRTTAAADLGDVPAAMPALMRAAKLQKRASGYGIARPDPQQADRDLEDALTALRRAKADGKDTQTALGELLFAAVRAARADGTDPEEALQCANEAFLHRVIACERQAQEQGKDLKQLDDAERDILWRRARQTTATDDDQS